jgi:hypothetical protein
MEAEPDNEKIKARHILLWLVAVALWILCLPVYLMIWGWCLLTGKNPRVRLWMFTSKK